VRSSRTLMKPAVPARKLQSRSLASPSPLRPGPDPLWRSAGPPGCHRPRLVLARHQQIPGRTGRHRVRLDHRLVCRRISRSGPDLRGDAGPVAPLHTQASLAFFSSAPPFVESDIPRGWPTTEGRVALRDATAGSCAASQTPPGFRHGGVRRARGFRAARCGAAPRGRPRRDGRAG
jgi:hypothetical protein